MQPLDVSTDSAFMQFLPGQKLEDDSALIVRFFVGKKLLGKKSIEAGREIYEDREFVEILIKGQDKQAVVEEVKPHHKQKYPVAYMAFKQSRELPIVGTPIEQLPGVGPSLAHTLKGLNIRSIEDMAGVGDNEIVLQAIGMGARDLVKRSKAWLDKTSATTVSLQEENAQLKDRLAKTNELLEKMNERLEALEKPKDEPRPIITLKKGAKAAPGPDTQQ